MVQYKVEIHTTCDHTAVADDSVVAGQGLKAYNALLSHEDVEIANADATEIEWIYEHSVCWWKLTKTTVEDTPVEDANCNVIPGPSDEPTP